MRHYYISNWRLTFDAFPGEKGIAHRSCASQTRIFPPLGSREKGQVRCNPQVLEFQIQDSIKQPRVRHQERYSQSVMEISKMNFVDSCLRLRRDIR